MTKEVKTNAMRILEKNKIKFNMTTYECDEFVDGISVASMLGQLLEQTFKTLVAVGKSKNYFVFVIPVAEELDLKKAAATVHEKSIELIPVKELTNVTGYIRGGCTPIGMKKQFQTVIHISSIDFETIYISGGRIGSQIELNPNDLLKVVKGTFGDITMYKTSM